MWFLLLLLVRFVLLLRPILCRMFICARAHSVCVYSLSLFCSLSVCHKLAASTKLQLKMARWNSLNDHVCETRSRPCAYTEPTRAISQGNDDATMRTSNNERNNKYNQGQTSTLLFSLVKLFLIRCRLYDVYKRFLCWYICTYMHIHRRHTSN